MQAGIYMHTMNSWLDESDAIRRRGHEAVVWQTLAWFVATESDHKGETC